MPPRRGVLQLTMPSWVHRSLRSEEHTSELQSQSNLVCRLLLEKKKQTTRLSPLCSPPRLRPRCRYMTFLKTCSPSMFLLSFSVYSTSSTHVATVARDAQQRSVS